MTATAPGRVKALRNILTMTGFTGAQAVIGAAAALVATIALGPDGRGVMVVGLTVGSFLAFAGGLGTGVAFRSSYASSTALTRISLVSTYTWVTLAATILSALLAAAGVAASAGVIDERLADTTFLLGVGCYTASQVLLVQLLEAWYADGRYNWAVASGAAMSAGGFLPLLVCLELSRTPASFLLAQGLGTLAVCAVVAARLRRRDLFRMRRIDPKAVRDMLAMGVPALGLYAGLAIVMRVDRYILGITSGPVAVGVYSLAGTLSEFPRLLPIATGQIMLREASLGRGRSTSTRLMRIAVLITAAGCVLVGVLGWFLIPPVFGPGFADARGLLVVLLAAEICFAPYAVASRGLLGGGWTVTAGSLGMVGAAGGVGLYAISAHIGGPTGTAVASVGLYAALSAASWLLLRRKFQVHSVATADPLASEPLTRG